MSRSIPHEGAVMGVKPMSFTNALGKLTVAIAISTSLLLPRLLGAQQPNLSTKEKLVAYSQSFAKRFAWPLAGATISIDQPLAMEIVPGSVELTKLLSCDIKLYIDSGLPIELPFNSASSSRDLFSGSTHFFLANDPGSKRWQQLSVADRLYYGQRQGAFNQLTALATPDYQVGNRGAFVTIPLRGFVKELFPGITYLHMTAPCTWIDGFEKKYSAIQIWLKRKSSKDYRDPAVVRIDSSDFVKLDVPDELIRRAKMSLLGR